MQYALFDGFERKFLLDALEFGVLKDWKENPVKELPDIDESAHPFQTGSSRRRRGSRRREYRATAARSAAQSHRPPARRYYEYIRTEYVED